VLAGYVHSSKQIAPRAETGQRRPVKLKALSGAPEILEDS
jgi:hypothetical protein